MQHIQFLSYFDVISSAVIIYDALLTIGLEVELIWKAPWTLLKVVYLVQKYLPLVDTVGLGIYRLRPDLSAEACFLDYKITSYMWIIGTILSEVVLTWRVWAVWHMNRKLAVLLPGLLVASTVSAFIINNIILTSLKFGPPPLNHIGCVIMAVKPIFYLLWVQVLVYDTVLLILMCVHGISAYKRGGNSAFFNAVYRDGVLYYLYIIAIFVVNIVLSFTLAAALSTILISLARVMQAILTSRVLLLIRYQIKVDVVYGNTQLRMHQDLGTQTHDGGLSTLTFASAQTVDTETGSI